MYDIEYLYMALQDHMTIAQVPLGHLPETRPSRINVLKCLMTDPPALLGVKFRGLAGVYRRERGAR